MYYLPKNVAIPVRFLKEGKPSGPFIKDWLRFLGLGRPSPLILYTPSE